MEFRALKYFLTAAREGSITKAANRLGLTQPNLSRQINMLERDIGKKLFNRSNYKIELTSDGALLKKRAEEIIDMIEKTRDEFKSSDKIIAGNIYIGTAETESSIELISKIIKETQKDYPNIMYHIYSGIYGDVIERLDKGLLDFGILIESADLSLYDYVDIPTSEVWGILARRDSKIAKKKFIEKKDLINLPIILPTTIAKNKYHNNKFLEWFDDDIEKLNIVLTRNLIYSSMVMVKEGLGYSLTLNNINTKEVCFIPLKPKLKPRTNIVWKKNQVFSPAGKIFLDRIYNSFSVKSDSPK